MGSASSIVSSMASPHTQTVSSMTAVVCPNDQLEQALESYAFFRTMRCKEEAESAASRIQQMATYNDVPVIHKSATVHRSFTLMALCAELAIAHAGEARVDQLREELRRERSFRVANALADKKRMEEDNQLVEDLAHSAGKLQKEVIQLRADISNMRASHKVLLDLHAADARHFHSEEARLKKALRTLVTRLRTCAQHHAKGDVSTPRTRHPAEVSNCDGGARATSHAATQTACVVSDAHCSNASNEADSVKATRPRGHCGNCLQLARQVRAFKRENKKLEVYVLDTLKEVRVVLLQQRNHKTRHQRRLKQNRTCVAGDSVAGATGVDAAGAAAAQ